MFFIELQSSFVCFDVCLVIDKFFGWGFFFIAAVVIEYITAAAGLIDAN